MKIHTESVHFTADQKLLEFIEKKMNKLETFYDKILNINVILKLENSGQVRDKVAEVKLQVPGDIIFCKQSDKTFESAIDHVAECLKKGVIKHKEKLAAV